MKLQEAATAVSMEEIRSRISACIQEHFESTGKYAWLVDVMGDDKSGNCVYSCDSGFCQADYKLRTTDSKATCTIDFEKAIGVVPHTVYKATEAAKPSGKSASTDGSGSKREGQASGSQAAAPGSGGEQNRGHLSAVERSAHSDNREMAQNDSIQLLESASTVEAIVLREARADYEIKLIAPGKGSSAFYPAEVLKRDGPKVFTEGTHVYLNHPTAAEESARPEGDVKNLAGVLSKGAYWVESHAKGPGLYGRMKVFADHAQQVEEKAPHTGMSIRAGGIAEAGRNHEGLPVLKELTHAESVDIVTKAGAGGMILTESAGGAVANLDSTPIGAQPLSSLRQSAAPTIQIQEAAMDAAELTKLQESIATANAANAKLLERALKGDAREYGGEILKGITLQEASKLRVIETVLGSIPKTEAGELDKVKFAEAVNAEAKREGSYVAGLVGSGFVHGMGPQGEPIPAEEAAKPEEINARAIKIFERLGHSKEAAEKAVRGRVA